MRSGSDRAADILGVPRTPTLDRAAAAARIRAALGDRLTPTTSILLSDRPLRPGQLINAAGERVEFPNSDNPNYRRCIVALVDPTPDAKWSHPAHFAFLPATGDGDVIFLPTDLPPHDEGPARFAPPGA